MKKITRVKIQYFLRRLGLLALTEKLRYVRESWRYKSTNRQFRNENPAFVLPPPHLAFDAYSAPDWYHYKQSGEKSAEFIYNITKKYLTNPAAIYEWGCGPARIIRHLPAVAESNIQIFGTDYNPETIEWAKKNISGVSFDLNMLNPPLTYDNGVFDLIYAISVFTHLSEQNALNWIDELHRVLKPNGILLITTTGELNYQTELLDHERKVYESKGVVVRDQYPEGKKMYLTNHNPAYVRSTLLRKFKILEHVPNGFPMMKQELWIARKVE